MDISKLRKFSYPICQSHKSFNKVFGIGANKTGTTTLQFVFEIIGLKVAPQLEGEIAGVPFYHGNFNALIDYINRFDAFQDAPFSIKYTYAQIDALFPNSKFILTHREPNEWFNSLLTFHKKIFACEPGAPNPSREDISKFTYIYPTYLEFMTELQWLIKVDPDISIKKDWELSYNKDHYINIYMQRNISILQHFSERTEDLLVIDITKEKDTKKIVEFLRLPPVLITDMPHLNRT
jgi:hypothetical protein